MPSDRLFPDYDINFRHAVDEIIATTASQEIAKENEARKNEKN